MRPPGPQLSPGPAGRRGRARPRRLCVHSPGLAGHGASCVRLVLRPLSRSVPACWLFVSFQLRKPQASLRLLPDPQGGSNTKASQRAPGSSRPPGAAETPSTLCPLRWGWSQRSGPSPHHREGKPRSGVSHSTLPLRAPQPPAHELSSALKGRSCDLSYSSRQKVVYDWRGAPGTAPNCEINGPILVCLCCVHCGVSAPHPPAPLSLDLQPWLSPACAHADGWRLWFPGSAGQGHLSSLGLPKSGPEGVQRWPPGPPAPRWRARESPTCQRRG